MFTTKEVFLQKPRNLHTWINGSSFILLLYDLRKIIHVTHKVEVASMIEKEICFL